MADRPLHVRLVTWDDDPPVGGQGVYARELRRALVVRGHRVTTVSGHGPHAVRYRRVTGRGHLDLSLALWRSPGVLLEGDPDLLHVSGGPGGVTLLRPGAVRRAGIPVVYTAHHTYRQAHRRLGPYALLGAAEGAAYRRAAALLAVSPSTAAAVRAMGVDPARLAVVSPGIEVPSPPPGEGPRVPGRMLFVGRLEREKGPLDAVAAMASVAARVPGAHGVVLGSGPLGREVRQAAEATGGRVAVAGADGCRPTDDEVAAAYRQAEVLLVPSSYEGLGLVALEAMAAGTAVVGYDVAGLHDTVGRHGVVVAPGDVTALAAAARGLLEDHDRRRRLAADGAAAVRRERSWARAAERCEAVYRSVLAGGGVPGSVHQGLVDEGVELGPQRVGG